MNTEVDARLIHSFWVTIRRREIEAQFEGFVGDADAASEPAAEESGDAADTAGADEAPPSFTLEGIGDKTMQRLIAAGFDSAEKIALASVDALSEVQGIGAKTAERVLAAARGETSAAPAAEE